MEFASAVPVKTKVVALVIKSLFEDPESLLVESARAVGAEGGVKSGPLFSSTTIVIAELAVELEP